MKWASLYFLGYVIFMVGVFMALWHEGILGQMGPTWTTIAVLVSAGIGVMIAVSSGGRKQDITLHSK